MPASCDQDHALFAKQFITCEDGRSGNNGDAWAVYSLTTQPTAASPAAGIDFKFVKQIARPFEFSADSFQIVLHSAEAEAAAAAAAESASEEVVGEEEAATSTTNTTTSEPSDDADVTSTTTTAITSTTTPATAATAINTSPNNNPTTAIYTYPSTLDIEYTSSAESMAKALEALEKMWIAVRVESDLALIRGGGLLKYIRFISRGWRVAPELQQTKMIRYMVTRFMIDFNPLVMSRYGMSMPQQALCDFIQAHVPMHDHALRALVFANLAQVIHGSGVPQSAELLAYMGLMVQAPPQHRQYPHHQHRRSTHHQHQHQQYQQQHQRQQHQQHRQQQPQQPQQQQQQQQRPAQQRSKSQSPKTSRSNSPFKTAVVPVAVPVSPTAAVPTFASALATKKAVAPPPAAAAAQPVVKTGVDAAVQTQRNRSKALNQARHKKKNKVKTLPPSPPSNTAKSTNAWPSLLSA